MSATTAQIYTDGACKGNPGPGGWAWVQMQDDQEVASDSGFVAHTTNNRMELQAVIEVLQKFPPSTQLHVLTDSTYVAKGLQQWLPNWKRNGWQTRNRKPVANQELWQQLDQLHAQREIKFSWVKGHAVSLGNQLADKYASNAAVQEFTRGS